MWRQKYPDCCDIESYVCSAAGVPMHELTASGEREWKTGRLLEAAEMVQKAAERGEFITAVTDYDADGINSAAEIFLILRKLGVSSERMQIIIPRRLSDGYGIGESILERVSKECTMLITIDNGITAAGPIKKAKERGMKVLVLDHHLHMGELPEADLIIDPEDNGEGWDFKGYCGAGLTYKLAEALFPEDEGFIDRLSVFAAIATVGDLVDVTGDNRNIILRGLGNLNVRNCSESVSEIADVLMRQKNIEMFGCEEIAFNVAPMINAPGRLIDDGGTKVLKGLFMAGTASHKFAEWLYDVNQKRKDIVAQCENQYEPMGEKVSVVYMENFPEGLCGILAAKVCEKTGKPSFVCTGASKEPGILKGSARSSGPSVHRLLQKAGDLLTRCGGHAEAAGFALKKENLEALVLALDKEAPEPVKDKDMLYDFEADFENLQDIWAKQEKIGAFGTGLQKPVIKTCVSPQGLRFIGKEKTTVSFKCGNIKFIAFSAAERYRSLQNKSSFYVYGEIGTNWYMGKPYMQFRIADFEEKER